MSKVVIGIDTSNYTTSLAAVTTEGEIVSDRRKMLFVKPGKRGLRQQEAFFQHVNNFWVLYEELLKDIGNSEVAAISCSVSPRPVEGSYMPVFVSGESFARVLKDSFRCDLYTFSHQEGHVQAAKYGTELEDADDFVFFHLSGGTTEAVKVPEYEIVGRTLDISFGQLIDRTGVALGIEFPCGKELDDLAASYSGKENLKIPKIKVVNGEVNLSGIETAVQKYISNNKDIDMGMLSKELFGKITNALSDMILQINEKTGTKRFLFAGGVSSSRYISEKVRSLFPEYSIVFGKPELCSDNAVGIALLGGRKYGA